MIMLYRYLGTDFENEKIDERKHLVFILFLGLGLGYMLLSFSLSIPTLFFPFYLLMASLLFINNRPIIGSISRIILR